MIDFARQIQVDAPSGVVSIEKFAPTLMQNGITKSLPDFAVLWDGVRRTPEQQTLVPFLHSQKLVKRPALSALNKADAVNLTFEEGKGKTISHNRKPAVYHIVNGLYFRKTASKLSWVYVNPAMVKKFSLVASPAK